MTATVRRVTCPTCGYPRAFDGKHCFAQGCGAKDSEAKRSVLDDAERADFKSEIAQKVWASARAPQGTPVEAYLRMRGITAPIPPSIRFTVLRHRPSEQTLPCIVAGVARWPERKVIAVHRTYLTEDGTKAEVDPQRMTLGPIGCGAVRLAPVGKTLIIGEGIETTMSAMQVLEQPGWAALSTGGMEALEIPSDVLSIWIAADNDRPGLMAAHRAASRWKREGKAVRILAPPTDGQDFNDMVQAR